MSEEATAAMLGSFGALDQQPSAEGDVRLEEASPADAPPVKMNSAAPAPQDIPLPAETAGELEPDLEEVLGPDPVQIPLPPSPLIVPTTPLPPPSPSLASSPSAQPPLAPPPRSRARPPPSPVGSGIISPVIKRESVVLPSPVNEAPSVSVSRALDYGEGSEVLKVHELVAPDAAQRDAEAGPSVQASLSTTERLEGDVASHDNLKEEKEDLFDTWSTPALPSFKGDTPPAASSPSSPSQAWTAPSALPSVPPSLPPRSSSLGATSPSPTTWTFPVSHPLPSASLKPPMSPVIADEEAIGPLPTRRSSSGVYTPASFPGPSPRKASAPAAVNRGLPQVPPATYRKASEGAGLGFGFVGSTSSVSQPSLPPLPPRPAQAPTATGHGGVYSFWSSARSYFSAPATPAAHVGPSPSAPSPSSSAAISSPQKGLAPSPLPLSAPPPTSSQASLASALFPAEEDILLPTGSLSPAGVYTPNSFYEQQQTHLRSFRPESTTPTVQSSLTGRLSVPTSPRVAGPPKSPSTVRKPAPLLTEQDDGKLAVAAPASARKPVPTYASAADSEDGSDEAHTAANSHSPPSSLAPSTPAWEQPETPPVEPAAAARKEDEGSAGFGGFKGLGKEMHSLQVEMPLETQESGPARVY